MEEGRREGRGWIEGGKEEVMVEGGRKEERKEGRQREEGGKEEVMSGREGEKWTQLWCVGGSDAGDSYCVTRR